MLVSQAGGDAGLPVKVAPARAGGYVVEMGEGVTGELVARMTVSPDGVARGKTTTTSAVQAHARARRVVAKILLTQGQMASTNSADATAPSMMRAGATAIDNSRTSITGLGCQIRVRAGWTVEDATAVRSRAGGRIAARARMTTVGVG